MRTHYCVLRQQFFLLLRRIALVVAIASAAGSAKASVLLLPNPEPDEWSDISISSVIGLYSGGMFFVMGFASGFDVGPGENSDFSPFIGEMKIEAMIDASGGVSSGNLGIDLPLMGPPLVGPLGNHPAGSNLLSGSITHAQFESPGVLHLQFTVVSGTAAGDFGGVGALGGVIINMVSGTNFPGSPVAIDPMIGPPAVVPFNSSNAPDDFADAFEITQGTADVIGGGAIPEPSAWMVWSAIVACALLAKHVSRAHNMLEAFCS
jgi:hypothetical protein